MSDLAPEAIKQLRASSKTTEQLEYRWDGGGGFSVARLSPDWVGVHVDNVSGETFTYTAPEATGEVLARSIAGHLGFYIGDDDPRFVGRKGRQRLAVVEGILTEQKAFELVEALSPDESMTVVCDGAPSGLSRVLQKSAKGTRILVMPDDLFDRSQPGGNLS